MTSGTFLVPIESHPSGATVLHEGRCVGITPCEAPVTVSSRHVELSLDGFHLQFVDVGTERNLWAAGNMVTLGVGLLVDVALGFDRVPNTAPVIVYLRSEAAPPPVPWIRPLVPTPEPPPPMSDAGHLVAGLLQLLNRR